MGGHEVIVKLLLDYEADVDAKDNRYNSYYKQMTLH
jgi:hypothetical protein